MAETVADRANTPSYIARDSAGIVIAASVDTPEMRDSNATEIAKWIRAGHVVERVPVWWVRKYWGFIYLTPMENKS